MNSKHYVSALIHYNKSSHFSAEADVLITVIAPATGIVLGMTIEAVGRHLIKKRREKLNSPEIIPATINSSGNNSNLFRKTLYRVTPTLAVRSASIVYEKLVSSQSLRIAVSSSFKVIDVIIIVRSVILSKNLLKYLVRHRENIFKITVNTLCWIVYSKKRDKMVQLAFVIVTALSTKLWITKNRTAQRLLRIWVCITFLNLCNYIYLVPSLSRPADIGVFGLPRVEQLMNQFNAFSETTPNSKISMLGKEEPLVLSSTLQNEMPKGRSKNVELEINKIIKNSTLGEENSILSQKEGLQKGKTSRTNFTSKPKRRMNSLQELNQTTDNVPSLPIENDSEKIYNSTKLNAEKVQ
jgi:hypothetical protein